MRILLLLWSVWWWISCWLNRFIRCFLSSVMILVIGWLRVLVWCVVSCCRKGFGWSCWLVLVGRNWLGWVLRKFVSRGCFLVVFCCCCILIMLKVGWFFLSFLLMRLSVRKVVIWFVLILIMICWIIFCWNFWYWCFLLFGLIWVMCLRVSWWLLIIILSCLMGFLILSSWKGCVCC